MPSRIAAYCDEHSIDTSQTPVNIVRLLVESIAEAFTETVNTAARISDHPVDSIHIVGGGALNALLCQRLADRSRRPVVAGPVEATAIGNVGVQAQALGLISPGADALRRVVADSFPTSRFVPSET